MKKDNSILLKQELPIAFKGSRDYIYASDVFSGLIDVLKNHGFNEIINIDFSVHNLSNVGIELIIYKNQLPSSIQDYFAQLRFESNGKTYFGIVKSIDKKITDRTNYDEQDIFENTEINKNDNSITLSNKYTSYSNLEAFTAMNKILLYSVRPDIKGQWLSVRLQLENYKDLYSKRENYKVVLKKIFSNKYAKSSLFNNDQKIGNLFFSLRK